MSAHHQELLSLTPRGPGLVDLTRDVAGIVSRSGIELGLATCFVRHTSASLVIQENADPDVQTDLLAFMKRLVPEGDSLYEHSAEGPDDMPAHIKTALTAVSLAIPISSGRMTLGTWQGIYLWEHRHSPGSREVVVHVTGELAGGGTVGV